MRPGGKADDQHARFPIDRAQGLVEGIAADGIEDHVGAEPAGQFAHPVADAVAAVIDQFVGAVLARDRELVRAAGGGDDPGAQLPADLDRAEADPAGGAEHEQGLARLQTAAMGQREMRGAVGDRKGGGGDEIHRVGDRHDRFAVDDDLLGIAAAEAQHREDPAAGGQMRHRRTGLDHLARGFKAGGERELRFDRYLPAIIRVSAKLTPEARTRMRASCGRKAGRTASSSRSVSGPPHSRHRIAFMQGPPAIRPSG